MDGVWSSLRAPKPRATQKAAQKLPVHIKYMTWAPLAIA